MGNPDKVWRALFIAAAVALGFSGFGQMPIYYRYYITSIPGVGWASDFYATQLVHYLAATVLLALVAFFGLNHLLVGRRRRRLTRSGVLRTFLLAGVIASGIGMVIKNLSGVRF
ncbi:MAG: FeS-binding protein, partial [Proteobacteria bacterium]|nr:FeS-binding protein [Pseudomonadota bacterium]